MGAGGYIKFSYRDPERGPGFYAEVRTISRFWDVKEDCYTRPGLTVEFRGGSFETGLKGTAEALQFRLSYWDDWTDTGHGFAEDHPEDWEVAAAERTAWMKEREKRNGA